MRTTPSIPDFSRQAEIRLAEDAPWVHDPESGIGSLPSSLVSAPGVSPGKEKYALWAAVHFPDLAAEIFGDDDGDSDRPLAVYRERGQRRRIEAVNGAARALGIHPGLTPAAACALAPRLRLAVRDEAKEQRRLRHVVRRLNRFSSKIAVSPVDMVLLEVGGSLRLFGGVEQLLSRLRRTLEGMAHRFFLAAAPTPLAATLLARCGRETVVSDLSRLVSAVGDLEAAALEISGRDLGTLRSMGVTQVTDLLRLPRDGLARRTTPGLLDLLDRLLGKRPDPVRFYASPLRFRAAKDLELSTCDTALLLPILSQMLRQMNTTLIRRCAAIRDFRVEFIHRRRDGRCTPLRVSTSRPGRDPERWEHLLRLRMESLRLPAPVCKIVLQAGAIAAWEGASRSLLRNDPEAGKAQREKLLEQLQNRLGNGAVAGLGPVPRHLPESAWQATLPGSRLTNEAALHPRPLWLLPEPRLLQEREIPLHANNAGLCLSLERERIRNGWWEGALQSRDYYTAVNERGEPLWIFRDNRSRRWYLHGYC